MDENPRESSMSKMDVIERLEWLGEEKLEKELGLLLLLLAPEVCSPGAG
jgi:hypothetical protein